jgi:hypothetical protein
MRNKLKDEIKKLLTEQLFKRISPGGWIFSLDEPVSGAEDNAVGAKLIISSPNGDLGVLNIEFKNSVEPKLVPDIKAKQERGAFGAYLVAAPFLSPRTRELLSQEDLSYVDLTGNMRIALRQPALFIETQGETKNPRRESKPMASLKGPAAGRVVRALCDFRPPYNTTELAKKSGASSATMSRALTLLSDEALITTSTKKRERLITSVALADLIRRWSQDYSVLKTNNVTTLIAPRGLSSLQKDLSTTTAEYSVTGSLAARIRTSVAPARLAMIYTANPTGLADKLGLRPAEDGANVLLLEPFDSVVFERTATRDGLICAAFSQVAADLLTSPGRGPEEAEELLRWMEKNEDDWRD